MSAIARRLEEAARGERITCAAALKIAGELGVPPAAVGRIADRAGIKIRSCRLGCF